MPYSTSNPPILIAQGIGSSTPTGSKRLWFYSSTDAATAVRVAGYITNARSLGMAAGDLVLSVDTDASPISLQMHIVSTINTTTGAGDLSDGTAVTATNSD